jgi:predicted pyridoxine 5'-phosphate oxidase superfamily flavin-nucleotide-binding protein
MTRLEMMKMGKEVLEMIEAVGLANVATADLTGRPNVVPKGSIKAVDDETLLYADLFPGTTRDNLEENPRIALSFVDVRRMKGFQIKGRAKVLTSGDVFERTCEAVASLPFQLPRPYAAVIISVDEVRDLAPGS